jgi:hypothetical protein
LTPVCGRHTIRPRMDRPTQHPVRRVVIAQGRRLTWVAEQLGISSNYLHRLLLPPEDRDSRPTPEWFYPKLAQLLGVPEEMLRPPTESVAA